LTATRAFYTNHTQAVPLPEGVAFPPEVHEVEVRAVGNLRIIRPADLTWDDWFDHGSRATADFMVERDQPGGAGGGD
jgi:antitoxin VapB